MREAFLIIIIDPFKISIDPFARSLIYTIPHLPSSHLHPLISTPLSHLPSHIHTHLHPLTSHHDCLADRLHELLQHIDSEGEMLLGNPFHLVGLGNGSTVAAAFLQRYGKHPSYAHSLRSFVSVNGYLAPDPQLRAILHSAASLFDSTPSSRPDIPFTFWSRFMFSEDYLSRVQQNMALNLFTAVGNPITSEGRAKLARGVREWTI